MRPYFRCFSRLSADVRCALQAACAASLVLAMTLSPLDADASAQAAPEGETAPVYLDLTLCAFSDDLELELLGRVLAAEAGDRSYAAQAALGAVLVNRLADPRYPSELGAVIGDAGLRAAAGEIPARSLRAAQVALMGVDPTHGAVLWGDHATVGTVTAEFDGVVFGR